MLRYRYGTRRRRRPPAATNRKHVAGFFASSFPWGVGPAPAQQAEMQRSTPRLAQVTITGGPQPCEALLTSTGARAGGGGFPRLGSPPEGGLEGEGLCCTWLVWYLGSKYVFHFCLPPPPSLVPPPPPLLLFLRRTLACRYRMTCHVTASPDSTRAPSSR